MKPDKYISSIEQILQQISALERDLTIAPNESERKRIDRLLNQQLKKMERLIPYKFRRELINICQESGIEGNFLNKK
ncbi:MAG: hypothetical protein KDD99_04675 [Bacteroidetes bacterium]|nr:hypothetical protein [Bacteroidota bacterium]